LPEIEDVQVSAARNIRPFLISWSLYAVFLLFYGAMLEESAPSFDFRNFYGAGYLMRTGPEHLYDLRSQQQVQSALVSPGERPLPFIHPAYEALLYEPFSLLPYNRAYLVFLGFNLLLLPVGFFTSYPAFASLIPIWQPRPGLLFFLFMPLFVALCQGQNSLLFVVLCCLAWKRFERGEPVGAGCMLGLGLFKFQLVIPLVLLCAARWGWRTVAGFAGSGTAVALVSLAITGRQGMTSFLSLLSAASLTQDQGATARILMAIKPRAMPNIVGLLYPLTSHLSAHMAFMIVACVSATLVAWCMLLVRRAWEERVAFSIAVVCALLVSYHSYVYELTLLVLPLGLLGNRVSKWTLFALYVTPSIVFWSGSRDWLFLLGLPAVWLLAGSARLVSAPSLQAHVEPLADCTYGGS